MKNLLRFIFLLSFFLSFTCLSHAWMRNIIISPTRAVIEKKKTINIKIINPTNLHTSYRIDMISMELDDKGSLYTPEKLNFHAEQAIKMLKYSPRRVKLEPNGIQTIRIMARKPADLPDGEYRCHMRVTPLPPAEQKINQADKNKETIDVKINYLVSTSIPLIIRHGDISKNIKVKELKLENEELFISMERTGKKSGLFNIEILQNNKIIGKKERAGFYFPNKNFTFKVKLEKPFNRGKKIKVRLVDLESENKEILDTFSSII